MLRPGRLLYSVLADTLYFFGDNDFSEWASLFQHYSPPPFSLLGTTAAYSFGIAGGYPARGMPEEGDAPGGVASASAPN